MSLAQRLAHAPLRMRFSDIPEERDVYTENKILNVVTMHKEGIVANKLYLQNFISENFIVCIQEHWLWSFQKHWVKDNFPDIDVD